MRSRFRPRCFCRLGIFQRGFQGNLLAACVNPMNVKCGFGCKKDQTRAGTRAGSPVNMVCRQVNKVSVMSDKRLLIFHLHFQRTAHHHRGLAWRMPVEWRDAPRSKLGQQNGRARRGISLFNRHREAFGDIRNRAEFRAAAGATMDFSSVPWAAKSRVTARALSPASTTTTTREILLCIKTSFN